MITATIDIETTSLAAVGSGILLCVCIRPHSSQRTRVFRIDSNKLAPSPEFGFLEREEEALMTDVLDECRKYDLLVGHNIAKFDIPFLKSRAYRVFGHGIQWQPFVYDTLTAMRRVGIRTVLNSFGKPSAGLAHVVDFFGEEQEKTGIYPAAHWQTVWGNDIERAEAMNNIVEHCKRDVRMNANIYPALLELDTRATIRRAL